MDAHAIAPTTDKQAKNAEWTRSFRRLVNPQMRIYGERQVYHLQSEGAAKAAVKILQDDIERIERQLANAGTDGGGQDFADWRDRATRALSAKRATVTQIKGALAILREQRQRQLVDLRLQRMAHSPRSVALARFAELAKDRLGEVEFRAMWEAAGGMHEAADDAA